MPDIGRVRREHEGRAEQVACAIRTPLTSWRDELEDF